MHVCLRGDWSQFIELGDTYRKEMDKAGIDVAIDLSGTREMLERADEIYDRWDHRILFCPGTFFHRMRNQKRKDLWWKRSDLKAIRDAGCAGIKIHAYHHRELLKKHISGKVEAQARYGLPCVGMHIADPPNVGYWQPTYWDCIKDAERLVRATPQVDFIMAHGYWLMNKNEGLDVLGRYFDRNPNLYVDLSAVYQWWNGPEPGYAKLRQFVIRYKDRLLYGTDAVPGCIDAFRYRNSYEVLETREEGLKGFFSDPTKQTFIKGLGLSKEVLNYIYWWNAARLIPGVREALVRRGYDL